MAKQSSKLKWQANSNGYSTEIGLLLVSLLIVPYANELFWKVEVRGNGTRVLDRGDGCDKLFPWNDRETAKAAALKFADEWRTAG